MCPCRTRSCKAEPSGCLESVSEKRESCISSGEGAGARDDSVLSFVFVASTLDRCTAYLEMFTDRVGQEGGRMTASLVCAKDETEIETWKVPGGAWLCEVEMSEPCDDDKVEDVLLEMEREVDPLKVVYPLDREALTSWFGELYEAAPERSCFVDLPLGSEPEGVKLLRLVEGTRELTDTRVTA